MPAVVTPALPAPSIRPATARQPLYLRLSVTPACNFRCAYCRPLPARDPATFGPLLDDSLLVTLVHRIHQVTPLRKIRITGGEPLLRRRLPELVAALRDTLPEAALCLTTNGARLAQLSSPLVAAGIEAINVSVDSADPEVFAAMTRGGRLEDVLAGVAAARSAGVRRLKLNAVLQRSRNGGELVALVRLAARCGCSIRLIELMPIGAAAKIFASEYLSADTALRRLQQALPYRGARGLHGVAEEHVFAVDGRDVTVGLIAPVSQPFCGGCDRVRLDAAGRLHACLRGEGGGADLAALLVAQSDDALDEQIRAIAAAKDAVGTGWPARSMAAIGG